MRTQVFSTWPTYPQLYVDGELVGGADIVAEMAASGELGDALSASPTTAPTEGVQYVVTSSEKYMRISLQTVLTCMRTSM